jgi:2-dehydro-3-deoxyphosphogalactonate aldolase
MPDLRTALAQCPVVAILRGITPPEVDAIGDALVEAGFTIIEVPLNSPEPFDSIGRLARQLGDRALVGAGTVRRVDQVHSILRVGGQIIVMPHADASVVRSAKDAGLVAVPGVYTPTEAFAMIDAGADALKLFPAEASSPAALKAWRAVLPADTLVIPVGGMDATTMQPWLAAGADGIGIGSALYTPGDTVATVRAKALRLRTQ